MYRVPVYCRRRRWGLISGCGLINPGEEKPEHLFLLFPCQLTNVHSITDTLPVELHHDDVITEWTHQ